MSAARRKKVTEPGPRSRLVAFVDESFFVEGHGYRVAFVAEGEPGYRWTGTWPYTGARGETMPWFWGPTFADAQEACAKHNAIGGNEPNDVIAIIGRSMAMGARR